MPPGLEFPHAGTPKSAMNEKIPVSARVRCVKNPGVPRLGPGKLEVSAYQRSETTRGRPAEDLRLSLRILFNLDCEDDIASAVNVDFLDFGDAVAAQCVAHRGDSREGTSPKKRSVLKVINDHRLARSLRIPEKVSDLDRLDAVLISDEKCGRAVWKESPDKRHGFRSRRSGSIKFAGSPATPRKACVRERYARHDRRFAHQPAEAALFVQKDSAWN